MPLLVFAPVVVWNAMHGWVSFAFQGERAGGLRFRPGQPFIVLAGEALFILPWIWLPVMAEFAAALRRGPAVWRSWLPVCLGAPPIVVFALIAAWSSQRVLFHWAAPGYLVLFPLLGAFIAQRIGARWVRATLIGTAVLVVAAVAIVSIQIRLDWLQPVIGAIAKHDPDLEGIDWTSLRTQLTSRGLLASDTIVGVPDWRDAGKIAYALGPDATVTVLDPDARQFGLIHPARDYVGRNVLVLVVNHSERALRDLAPMFDAVETLPPASIDHRGLVLQLVSVFLGKRLRAAVESNRVGDADARIIGREALAVACHQQHAACAGRGPDQRIRQLDPMLPPQPGRQFGDSGIQRDDRERLEEIAGRLLGFRRRPDHHFDPGDHADRRQVVAPQLGPGLADAA